MRREGSILPARIEYIRWGGTPLFLSSKERQCTATETKEHASGTEGVFQ